MDTLTGSPSHVTFNWPHEHEAILETILPSHPSIGRASLYSPTRSWSLMKRSLRNSRCRTGFLQYSDFENLPIWEVSSLMGQTLANNIGAPHGTLPKLSRAPIRAISQSNSRRASSW